MELIQSFLSEADELLTRINEEVLELEGDPDDHERLNTVYRTAHTLKGSANLYGYSGIALLAHLLESLLDELRDGLQRMDASFTDLLLEGFDQIRFLVRGIEMGQDDPQPESDLLHRLREAVRSESVRVETKASPPLDTWVKQLTDFAAGQPGGEAKTFAHFMEQFAVAPGDISLPASWREPLDELAAGAQELRRKRKKASAREKLAVLSERLVALAGSQEERSDATDAALRLLLTVPLLLKEELARGAGEDALPAWWSEVWSGWSAEAEQLAGDAPVPPSIDTVLDVWELCTSPVSSMVPTSIASSEEGLLLTPLITEPETPAVSAYEEVAAAAAAPPIVRKASAPSAPDAMMARRLVIEQIRFLAPRGKPILERWELARGILSRCARLIGDDRLLELAGGTVPDMTKLKISVKPYIEHEESLWTEQDLSGSMPAAGTEHMSGGGSKDVRDAVEGSSEQDRTIRIEQGKIDSLMELIGELAVAKNAFPYLIAKLDDPELASAMKEKAAMLDRITKELQDAILDVRMLPLSSVFSKFSRFVRDLAKQSGKQVQLEIAGEETTLDKTLVEELSEPLLHIVRNAIDHGIESAEERKRVGKLPEGELRLCGWREGNKVWIEIRDDGRGIDTDRIRQQLLKQGELSREEVEGLSYDDLLAYIFQAGFSTAEGVTSISGRGVGMDAVMSSIRHMQGQLHVISTPGEGTSIRIELPMTLTMTQVLQVVVGGQSYGIPLDQIESTMRVKPEDIHPLQGQRVIKLSNRVISLIQLKERFALGSSDAGDGYTVIMKNGVGLMVDGFRGQQEVVIKPLDPALKRLNYLSGAAILGDGSVLLILNGEGFS